MLFPRRASTFFSLFCMVLVLIPVLCIEIIITQPPEEKFPSEIRLSGGVLHSPPFAYIDDQHDGTDKDKPRYRGFMIDLLERLKMFAETDDVDLKVDLTDAPVHYSDAFDLVASDCDNSTAVGGDCNQFDLIVGDFYSNPDRSMRGDLSPPWLHSTTTTLKYIDKEDGRADVTTLKEAEESKVAVCVPKGTFMEQFAWTKFPRGVYVACGVTSGECLSLLKAGNCSLFVYDELILHYMASNDYTVEVTRETFNTQYMVWPMKETLPPMTSRLIKKWLYRAVQNSTMDELYHDYFRAQLCPQGTAGKKCEKPCDPDNGAANARGECVCKSIRFTGDDCSIEVPEELNLLPKTMVIMCYALVAVSFLVVIGFTAWFVYNRDRAQVRITQPSFLLLILLGCVISTSTIIALAQEDPGDGPVHACMAIPWLYSVGFSLTFGAMFARIRRIYVALQYAAEMSEVTVSAKETALTVGLVLAIDVAILSVWTIVDPLEWERITTSTDVFGVPLESEGYCHSEHWSVFAGIIGVFHLFLMGTACYMTYIARNLPNSIANLKYVGIAMFSNLQIFLMVVPVLLVVGSDPQTSFLVRSLAIWINDFVVVLLIFGSFIYRVYKFDRRNKEKSDRNLSIVNSRVAVRASIVSFARNTSTSEISKKSLTSCLSSKRRSNRSVRFSDQVGDITQQPVRQLSWADRAHYEFDQIEEASSQDGQQTQTTKLFDQFFDHDDTREPLDPLSLSDSAVSTRKARDLKKGKSDSEIAALAGLSGSLGQLSGPSSLDVSEVEQDTDAANGSGDTVLDKPDFRRHRSLSEPSLTALQQPKQGKPGQRLNPEMPQEDFMELVFATYGAAAAPCSRADLPEERFRELWEQTYGVAGGQGQDSFEEGSNASAGEETAREMTSTTAAQPGEETIGEKTSTSAAQIGENETGSEEEDVMPSKHIESDVQEESKEAGATIRTDNAEEELSRSTEANIQAKNGSLERKTDAEQRSPKQAESKALPNASLKTAAEKERLLDLDLVPGEPAGSLDVLRHRQAELELWRQRQAAADFQSQVEQLRQQQRAPAVEQGRRRAAHRQSALEVLRQSQCRSSAGRRGPTFWGPKQECKPPTAAILPGAVYQSSASEAFHDETLMNDKQDLLHEGDESWTGVDDHRMGPVDISSTGSEEEELISFGGADHGNDKIVEELIHQEKTSLPE